MTRREKEKKDSLDALARIAASVGFGANEKPKAPSKTTASASAPKPKPAPVAKPLDAKKAAQLDERRTKLAEEKALKQRRANELARGGNLQWRGGGFTDIPASIRRTGFDRVEPSVSQKISDVLGDARLKEGREKARDKGKRQGGR